MIEAPHYSATGTKRKAAFALPAGLFDGTVNEAALHQAVKVFLNNQRQGTAATKTRALVSGGNQKPWRQKGTGRARQGSIRAPHWRGGGTVFGPQPRDYRTDIPRKLRQLARRSALNTRAADGLLFVVEGFDLAAPKTRQLADLIGKLDLAGRKVLLLTHGSQPAVYLSGRNLPDVRVLPFADAAAYDVLWAEAVVVEEAALADGAGVEASEEGVVAAAPAKKAPAKKPAKQATKKAAPRAAKKATTKAAKKAAPKKAAPKKKGGK